jgi:hypothetical protein
MKAGRAFQLFNGAGAIYRARIRLGEKSTASTPNKLRQVRENIFQER